MKLKTSALAVTTFVLLAADFSHADASAKSVSADLDGDGKPETVSLQWKEGDPQFVLTVGGATLRGSAKDTEVGEMSVVDITRGDKRKEVAVTTGLTDSDRRVHLYRFDGKGLKTLGSVPALTEARGNGIILSDSWQGFWNRRDKYVLDPKTEKVSEVPQELYSVGAEATVKQSFPLVRSRSDSAPIAHLAQGSKIQVLAAMPSKSKGGDYLYLVKSSTGLLGWATAQHLQEKTDGLPWAG